MPHGTPDWGLVGPKQTTYGMDDEGEAAVRLGSPHFFDRRGDVLLITDFREGLGAFYDNSPVLATHVELWTGHSRSGAYSIGLRSSPGGANLAQITAVAALPVYSLIGLEFTFSTLNGGHYVLGRLQWANPTNTWIAAVRYNENLSYSEYLNAAGGWTQIPGTAMLVRSEQALHTIKFVVDMTPDPATGAGQYVRVLIDEVAYLLTGIGVQPTGMGTQSQLWVDIVHQSFNVVDLLIHIDNVILTQNEPLYQG